jgi:glutamyl endopeptidase
MTSECTFIDEKTLPAEFEKRGMDAGLRAYGVPETICGQDDRSQVSDTTQGPYWTVCFLRMNLSDGAYDGTGWLLSLAPDSKYTIVVTSAHNIYDERDGSWAETVSVVPGRNGSSTPYGRYMVRGNTRLRVPQQWIDQGSDASDYDYGVILIDKQQGLSGCGAWAATDSELNGADIMVSGYPGDKAVGTNWEDVDPITRVTKPQLYYMNDTVTGNSGSPIFARKGTSSWSDWENIWCVGIHGYGGCPNHGIRMTNDVYTTLYDWGAS